MIRASLALSLTSLLFLLIGCNRIDGSAEGSKEATKETAAGEKRPDAPSEKSKEAAQAFLEGEINKWMAGQPTKAISMKTLGGKPVGYKIIGVVPVSNSEINPDYRFNTTLTFESKAGTPTDRVVSYYLIWLPKGGWELMEDHT